MTGGIILEDDKLGTRLAILHDEDLQHFVTTCTEVVSRIVINPGTRTNTNLFNQENVPCETLFYSVLQVIQPRRKTGSDKTPIDHLTGLLKANPTLQLGGDETTGRGFCEASHQSLPLETP
jgi:CRISPR-associated protein Cmr4